MKLEPHHRETVVIDPRTVADNGVGDNAWCEEDFEEEEQEDEEDSGEEEGEEDADCEDEAEEQGEAVNVARAPSPASPRPPRAERSAVYIDLNAPIPRHLLEELNSGPPPRK